MLWGRRSIPSTGVSPDLFQPVLQVPLTIGDCCRDKQETWFWSARGSGALLNLKMTTLGKIVLFLWVQSCLDVVPGVVTAAFLQSEREAGAGERTEPRKEQRELLGANHAPAFGLIMWNTFPYCLRQPELRLSVTCTERHANSFIHSYHEGEMQGIKVGFDLVRRSEMVSLRKCRGLGERDAFSCWALYPVFKDFGLYCRSRAPEGFHYWRVAGEHGAVVNLSCLC